VAAFDARSFEVEVEASAFAETWGASPTPVCHFLRGVMAGIGAVVYGAARAKETACLATGAKACRFVCEHD
jgi:predicted hydrocarbon binding protein